MYKCVLLVYKLLTLEYYTYYIYLYICLIYDFHSWAFSVYRYYNILW